MCIPKHTGVAAANAAAVDATGKERCRDEGAEQKEGPKGRDEKRRFCQHMKRSDERNEGEGGGGGEWGGHLCKPLWTFVRENESLEPKTRTLALSSNSTKYAHDILLVSFFLGGEGGKMAKTATARILFMLTLKTVDHSTIEFELISQNVICSHRHASKRQTFFFLQYAIRVF